MDGRTDVRIREETGGDVAAIREVNRLAFGQDAEGRLVEAGAMAGVRGRVTYPSPFAEV